MTKWKFIAFFFSLLAIGLASCSRSEPDSAEVESAQEVTFDGPAFVLFFTDP